MLDSIFGVLFFFSYLVFSGVSLNLAKFDLV
jgi:hypothetical protein